MKILFETDHSKVVLSKFKTKIDSITPIDDFETGRNSLIRLVIGSMASAPEQWDSQCQINIEWIGDQFISRLTDNSKELNKEYLDDVCGTCFRFLFELFLSTKNDLTLDFEQARRFVFDNLGSFDNTVQVQIEFAIKDMPINILKQLINSEAITSIKEFNSVSAKAEELKANWNAEIKKKEIEVQNLKDALDQYKTAFNFVGLHEGFDELAAGKKKELEDLTFWLRIVSILVVLPILGELGVIYLNLNDLDAVRNGLLVSILPTLSLVFVSIYYFRVLLFNYRSVKSQIVQIELRKTLCRFIQHYADYSTEIKEKDSEALSKFENIIFSGIVTDDNNPPSTYDGVDQITRLIKSIKP